MTKKEFHTWIQGYLDLSSELYLTPHEIRIIYNHAILVKALNKNKSESMEQIIDLLNEMKQTNVPVARKNIEALQTGL
jgi:hypothetical protein